MDCTDPKELTTLCSLIEKKKCYLTFFHLNERSINNKKDELDTLFNTFVYNFDVIILTETWGKDVLGNHAFAAYDTVVSKPKA